TGIGAVDKLLAPLAWGGTDRNTTVTAETGVAVVQSESFVWSDRNAGGNTVAVAFNDSSAAPGNFSRVSTSTDQGVSFTRLAAGTFPSTFGDPVIFYNRSAASNKWHTVWLSSPCGGQGLGEYVSNDAITWVADGCVHSNSQD